MDIPQTLEEAHRQGYRTERKTPEEARRIIEQGAVAGFDLNRARDCSTIPPHHICWEGECDATGMKEVLYCDDTQGCTIYAKVKCRP